MTTSDQAAAAVAGYRQFLEQPEAVAADLERFCAMLLRWNAVHNLVSRETTASLWERHVADSLQLLPLLRPDDRAVVDLGSGGGFPAIPLAIASRKTGRRFTLFEMSQRKAAFLRAVIRELGLDAAVEQRRIESADAREILPNVVTARALAPLPALLSLAFPLFGPTARGLFHKGIEHGEELAQSVLAWTFDVIIHPSVTGSGGVILELSRLRPRSDCPAAENRR
jgi:16S rRNA (guanine527-N7)-methyltransferase